MSFELTITTPTRPTNLRELMEREFASHGFDVEVYPKFEHKTWAGGFLPFRVARAPVALVGVTLDQPVVSGFELTFSKDAAHLRTSNGRTTTEFALQCLSGAILAKVCGGHYIDDQNGITCSPMEAIAAAIKETKEFLKTAREHELAKHPFPGWAALEG